MPTYAEVFVFLVSARSLKSIEAQAERNTAGEAGMFLYNLNSTSTDQVDSSQIAPILVLV